MPTAPTVVAPRVAAPAPKLVWWFRGKAYYSQGAYAAAVTAYNRQVAALAAKRAAALAAKKKAMAAAKKAAYQKYTEEALRKAERQRQIALSAERARREAQLKLQRRRAYEELLRRLQGLKDLQRRQMELRLKKKVRCLRCPSFRLTWRVWTLARRGWTLRQ